MFLTVRTSESQNQTEGMLCEHPVIAYFPSNSLSVLSKNHYLFRTRTNTVLPGK